MVYVVVTFFGSMVAAAILAKFGMERQVKPLVNFQSACCADEKTKPDVGLVTIKSAATGCCSIEIAQPQTLSALPAFQSPSVCCAGEAEMPVQQQAQASCCTVNLDANDSVRIPFKEKMKNAASAAVDTFKGVFWYLLLGAGIGAFIYGFFPQDLIVRLAGPGNPWSIPIAAAIGVPMYIRAETVIPISAALVGKGMGVGTVLALIIGGAGASIPEIIILGSMFRKKLIFTFVLNVFLVAIAAGYLVDLLIY